MAAFKMSDDFFIPFVELLRECEVVGIYIILVALRNYGIKITALTEIREEEVGLWGGLAAAEGRREWAAQGHQGRWITPNTLRLKHQTLTPNTHTHTKHTIRFSTGTPESCRPKDNKFERSKKTGEQTTNKKDFFYNVDFSNFIEATFNIQYL